MNGKNVKTVKITVPNIHVLRMLKITPLYQRLTKLDLKLGENFEQVNHYQFSEQIRMFPIAGAQIEEVTKSNVTK